MEEGSMDGLGVRDALALAVCFGAVVATGLCWMKRAQPQPEAQRMQALNTRSRNNVSTTSEFKTDLGLEDLESALKEAEKSMLSTSNPSMTAISKGSPTQEINPDEDDPSLDNLDAALKQVEDAEKALADKKR
mmetsp:Transcript_24286/g.33955  ORF Transcript_24286/g.33955 Transcript_24286/m.33955 type:complete len:133 (+) Transcript_24286:24-422(+)|eukprot:CAMPEP_0185263482 /NCGR_PEP_ID=MMETSP1359-20130426/15232_1 /TAXON_ID=552665 /ORGANISM="Bigelowiella longifila, Strain CCMP242" /LENGTH=132 /DNA_ID=CAMNT_0027851051 /DNA_START=24 /DNA_END=422 /DNA_ORIENTATION=+